MAMAVLFRILLWTIALMSGLASIVREWIATFSPGAVKAPSLFDACLVTCFVASCTYAWCLERQNVNRLQKKLLPALGIAPKILWQDGENSNGWHYATVYIEIFNDSAMSRIDGVAVRLTKMEPEVKDLDWLPVPLHIKHDNPAPGQQNKTEFSLNAGERKHIDLATAYVGAATIAIEHVVPGVTRNIPSQDRYTLVVQATGRDVPPTERKFSVWMEDDKLHSCVI